MNAGSATGPLHRREIAGVEAKGFVFLAGGFFAILFGSYLGQNAGLAILIERHGASALPRAYMANAVVLAAMSFLTTRLVRRLPLRAVMIGVFVTGAAAVELVRWALGAGYSWAGGALYVTAFALTDLLIVLFWSLANRVYDTRDAKRVFPLVGAAGTLGAAVSGFFAQGFVARIGTTALLDIWAAILVGCAVWSGFAAGRTAGADADAVEKSEAAETSAASRAARASVLPGTRGLLWAIGAGLVFVVMLTLFGRFLYGRALQAEYPDAEALAGVNGLLIGLSSVLTLVVQLFVASRLMSWLGVGGVGAVYPLVMLGAFAGLYAHFGMATAVVCFFGITTVRRGIQGVVENVLYTPLPPGAAARTLVFMAMVAMPLGLALAGGGLELLKDAAPRTVALFGLAAAVACGLAAALRAYGYRSALRTRLLRGGSDVRVRFGALLGASSATVESILSEGLDPNDPDVLERLRTLVRAHQQEEERGRAAGAAAWDEAGPLGRVVDAKLAECYRLHAALEALPRIQAREGEGEDDERRLEDLWRSAIRQRIGEDVAVVLAALRAGTHLADFDRISLRVSDADRRVRAAAVEILDTLCPEGVRPLVLPLLEERRLSEGAREAKRRYGEAAALGSGGAVATLLDMPDDWVRATTAYATAHLGGPGGTRRPAKALRRLRELASSSDKFVSFAASYALARSGA